MHSTSTLYKIALTCIKGVGLINARQLVAYCGGVEAIFKERKAVLEKIPGIGPGTAKNIVNKDVLEMAEVELNFVSKYNIGVHFYQDQTYPFRLSECTDAPLVFYTKGNTDFNKQHIVSIVGTRNASRYGKHLTDTFVADLAVTYPNAVVVSGLAYGIDIQAHKAALENGLETIAVLGSGLDKIYPSAHTNTARQIVERGALLTEYRSGSKPDAQNFVKRNRIVAGMCDALLVVESGIKGGSLITANQALSYNRDVFAFPGHVGEAMSEGCNNLIKTNRAGLIESFADMQTQMGWEQQTFQTSPAKPKYNATEEEQKILDLIRESPEAQVVLIAKLAQMELGYLHSLLFEMELKGMIRKLPGNVFDLV